MDGAANNATFVCRIRPVKMVAFALINLP